jgi:putative transposase
MGLRYPGQKYNNCFFITTSFRNREKLGDIPGVYDALTESLVFYGIKYKVRIAGYVLMPSHIHLLIFIDGTNLADFMRDFKKFTAQKAIKELGMEGGNIWMPRYDRVTMNSENIFRQKLEYIHNNPVKAGLRKKGSDWNWSSAADYETNNNGLVPVWKDWC